MSALAAVAGCGSGSAPKTAPPAADLVLVGGDLHTMDPERPRASALAVRGERLVVVGDDADVEPLIGAATRVIRLEGRSVTPGLVDAHAHLQGLGAALESVSLRGAASAEEAAARVAAAAAARPAGEWVTGRGWDQNLWEPQAFPHHRVLDALVPDHPVALRRVDGHALWANAAAMARAGVTADTADPPGGLIVRDDAGAPTGVFIDTAMSLVEARVPAPDEAAIERRIVAAAKVAVAAGLTGVHEMGAGDATLAIYRRLAAEGRLPLRVYVFLAGDIARMEELTARPIEPDTGTSVLSVRGIKLYADGALGSRGAKLLAPYSDDPDNRGIWVTPPAKLRRAAELAAAGGWQLGVHAIGDAGNRAVLDAFEAAIAARPGADLRFRVEHAQVVAPEDLPRFGRLGVIASMQPTHATSDMPWAEDRVGPERVRGAYAWRSILDSGGRIAAGSDFPVEEVSPLLGLHAAVARQDGQGQPVGGWLPAQRMSLGEAIAAFTVEPAFASFVEGDRGRLRPGHVADITVYDRALSADATLLQTAVDLTVVGGQVVFERP